MQSPDAMTDAARCSVGAARLDAQRPVAAFALLLVAATLLAAWQGRAAGGASFGAVAAVALAALLAACGERVLAVRIAFDARLFAWLAAQPEGGAATGAMDAALVGWGLMPAGKAGRPLAERLHGARRLLRLHGAVVAVQAVLLVAALAVAVRGTP